MNIDLGSFSYGSTLQRGVGTPSWGTSLGQSRPEYYITRKGSENVVMGMVYCSVPLETVSLPLGRGGRICNCIEAGTIQIASVFQKVFINGINIHHPFIMVLQKEESDSHSGRRGIKYSDKSTYEPRPNQIVSNYDFVREVYHKFGLSDNACWFVYDIDVKNYEELHMKVVFVNKAASEEYFDSHTRSEKWAELINNAGDKYDVHNAFKTNLLKTISSQYRTYTTAIKSKPFLLLAGISGTGKSRIVRELARACWNVDSEEYKAQKPKNFEMVQVKPNWHDSGELIGYVSRVSGKAEFVAGDFLKFVAKAWEDLETPYFLCLDEMNLAPVEQYFAEYLSVVESRKRNDEGMVVTDPIIYPQYEHERDENTGELVPKEWYKNLVKELLAECSTEKSFALNKQFMNEGISLPQNLIVIGTVNMDETTFSFSRKVLDRAMTIEMNEVDLYGGLKDRHEVIGKIGNNELVGTAVEGVDVYSENKDVCDTAIAYLAKLNDILEGTPFKVAYRTRNEFLLYVVNNLPYSMDKEGNELPQGYVIARALDEITSMKILSRIEGDDTKVKESLLDNLMNAIKDELMRISGEENPVESVSIAKLKEMKDRLNSGYTSFWT